MQPLLGGSKSREIALQTVEQTAAPGTNPHSGIGAQDSKDQSVRPIWRTDVMTAPDNFFRGAILTMHGSVWCIPCLIPVEGRVNTLRQESIERRKEASWFHGRIKAGLWIIKSNGKANMRQLYRKLPLKSDRKGQNNIKIYKTLSPIDVIRISIGTSVLPQQIDNSSLSLVIFRIC